MTALSILIVEDDAMIGILLAEVLEAMGYVVRGIAVSEDDAVADAAYYAPDLMIVDEHLRAGSGNSAVDRIRRTRPIPCVFISAAPERPTLAGEMLLLKPFVEADLRRAIEHVIGQPNCLMPHLRSFIPDV